MKESSRENGVLKSYLSYFAAYAIYNENDRMAKIHSIILTIFNILSIILLIYSFIKFIPDIDKMSALFHHFTLLVDMAAHVIIFYYYRPTIKRLIEDLYVTHEYKSDLINKFSANVQDEREEKAKRILRSNFFTVMFGCVIFLLAGLSDRYIIKKSDYFLLIPMAFPISLDTWTGYIMLFIWETLALMFNAGMVFGVFDFLYLFYLKVTTEFKILDYALSTITKRALEMKELNEKKSNKKLHNNMGKYYEIAIRHCVIHHIQIISTFDDIRQIGRWMYFFGNAVNLVLLVLSGFTLVTDDLLLKIKFCIFMGITLLYAFFFFWFGQDMIDESENILLTLHTAEWLDMPKKCRTTLHLMMTRTMKPCVITAVDGVDITMENFMALLSAAYSYFSFLIQMKD